MEWIDLATKGLWVLLLGLAMGVGAMRIRARRNRLRFVEFSGDGVGEEAGGWRVEFDVPLSGKAIAQPVRLEWVDATGATWLEWEQHLTPGHYSRVISPKGKPGRCSVRLTAPGVRAERYVQWSGDASHPVGHLDAEQPHR